MRQYSWISLVFALSVVFFAAVVVPKYEVQDGGSVVGTRNKLNFIDGTEIAVTAADNAGSERVDVTIGVTSNVAVLDTEQTWGSDQPFGGFSLEDFIIPQTTITAATYTATTTDNLIGVNRAGVVTITLPSGMSAGRTFVVTDESGAAGSNTVTIDTAGSELIDGAASVTITTNYGSVPFYFNGTDWFSA